MSEAEAAPRPMWIAIAAAVAVVAGIGYAFVAPRGSPTEAGGRPVVVSPGGAADSTAQPRVDVGGDGDGETRPVGSAEVEAVIAQLVARLKDRPDDATGWSLLARAYAATDRSAQSLPAFRKALTLAGDDADLLADYADALASGNRGRLGAEELGLVDRALKIDPGNAKALALAGRAAFDRGDYEGASLQWRQATRGLAADDPFRTQLQSADAQARELAHAAAAALSGPAAPASTMGRAAPAPR